jgi:hypothetical protein
VFFVSRDPCSVTRGRRAEKFGSVERQSSCIGEDAFAVSPTFYSAAGSCACDSGADETEGHDESCPYR